VIGIFQIWKEVGDVFQIGNYRIVMWDFAGLGVGF
jgi:hypothetical protein